MILLVLPLALFTSCEDDDMVWDFAVWNVVVTATDADGVDLFEETKSGELFAECDGNHYPLSAEHTRAIPAIWRGLIKRYDSRTGLDRVLFGQFTPESGYRRKSFTLNWQDGTSVEITFDCYITWKRQKATVHTSAKVNGKTSWVDPQTGMVISVFMEMGY